MPLIGLLLGNTALGLLAALAAARELRASPRAAVWSRGFGALALHQVLVAMPVAGYLLFRFTDWMVSYLVDGARMPSALLALAVLAHAGLGLGGYAVGAHWLRAHHGRRAAITAGALGAVAFVGAVMLRHRMEVVGSTLQYRGGFGLMPFGASRALGAVALLGAVNLAAAGQLFASLRALGSRGVTGGRSLERFVGTGER